MTEIARITSRQNRRLVHARKVRDERDSSMFIEGKRLVTEALSSNLRISECFFTEDLASSVLLRDAAERGADLFELTPAVMQSISAVNSTQGIALLADRPPSVVDDFAAGGTIPLFIYLSEINNPSNLGAVLRSAEAAGVSGVFISEGSADAFSPKSLRASMGSAFRLPITERASLDEVIARAAKNGISSVALAAEAAESYLDIDWSKTRLLVVGSEAHGLSEEQLRLVDVAVFIPMNDPVESLNLGVAAGIVMYEARRQNA